MTESDNNHNHNHNTQNDDMEQTIRDAELAVPERTVVPGMQSWRFRLFHMPFSVDSFKVRVTLAECGWGYVSHELDATQAFDQLYHPAYVQLRLQAWYDLGKPPLAGEQPDEPWTGVTSVETEGLDLMVVPTLVDMGDDDDDNQKRRKPKVIVNTESICRYLATLPKVLAGAGQALLPPQHQELIDKHLKLVDRTPHMALLYDGNSQADRRPYFLRSGRVLRHASAVPHLQKRLSQRGPGDDLERAYRAKLARKQKGASMDHRNSNATRAAYLEQAVHQTMESLVELEQDLSQSPTRWICGTSRPTLADFFVGLSLYRLTWLGNAWMWKDNELPHVARFAEQCFALPSIQTAAIFVSTRLSMPHSRSVTYLHRHYRGTWAALQNEGRVHFLNSVAFLRTHARVATAVGLLGTTAAAVAALSAIAGNTSNSNNSPATRVKN